MDLGSLSMTPSPSLLLTFSSYQNRSAKPSHQRCAWHFIQGLSISDKTDSMALTLSLNGFLRPGQSNTRYLTFFHSSSMGVFFLMAEIVSENLPRPMKSSPSSWLLGQFLVKNLGKKNRLPFLEYMTEPVQKHRTPSSFQLMIHPAGSMPQLQVQANKTFMHPLAGGPNLDLVSTKLPSSQLMQLLQLFASELFLLWRDMASSVISVMERTFLPLIYFLGLVLCSFLVSRSSSIKEQMNLWLIGLQPSFLIHYYSSMHCKMASSSFLQSLISTCSFLPSSLLVIFIFVPLTYSFMLSLPSLASQYSPLNALNLFSPLLTTLFAYFFSYFFIVYVFGIALASWLIQPLVNFQLIFWIADALAAAIEGYLFSTFYSLDQTPSFTFPTLKVTLTPFWVTSQNLLLGCSKRTGLLRSNQRSQMFYINQYKDFTYNSVQIQDFKWAYFNVYLILAKIRCLFRQDWRTKWVQALKDYRLKSE